MNWANFSKNNGQSRVLAMLPQFQSLRVLAMIPEFQCFNVLPTLPKVKYLQIKILTALLVDDIVIQHWGLFCEKWVFLVFLKLQWNGFSEDGRIQRVLMVLSLKTNQIRGYVINLNSESVRLVDDQQHRIRLHRYFLRSVYVDCFRCLCGPSRTHSVLVSCGYECVYINCLYTFCAWDCKKTTISQKTLEISKLVMGDLSYNVVKDDVSISVSSFSILLTL